MSGFCCLYTHCQTDPMLNMADKHHITHNLNDKRCLVQIKPLAILVILPITLDYHVMQLHREPLACRQIFHIDTPIQPSHKNPPTKKLKATDRLHGFAFMRWACFWSGGFGTILFLLADKQTLCFLLQSLLLLAFFFSLFLCNTFFFSFYSLNKRSFSCFSFSRRSCSALLASCFAIRSFSSLSCSALSCS